MNDAETQDAVESLEDYLEFVQWKKTHRPMTKSKVALAFGVQPKETEADKIRKVLNLLEVAMKDGDLDLSTFEKFRQMGEIRLQQIENGQSGSEAFAKSIVSGTRLGTVSYVEGQARARALQNLSGRVGSSYFADWMSIGQ